MSGIKELSVSMAANWALLGGVIQSLSFNSCTLESRVRVINRNFKYGQYKKEGNKKGRGAHPSLTGTQKRQYKEKSVLPGVNRIK